MASTNESYSDVLIVGGGIFGTSTAYHLSKNQPLKITVIDRTPTPPRPAASTDINKIVRADYSSRFYMDLAFEAMDAWYTWPELKDKIHRTGWISVNEEGSDLGSRIRKNFRDRGHDPTSDVSLLDLRKMFGGIFEHSDFTGFDSAYWNPEAGWCDAAFATAELMKSAISNGVRYVTGDVGKILLDGRGVQGVQTRDGHSYLAGKVLLATGAWTSSIMSDVEDALGIEDGDRVEKQAKATGVCVAHYKLDPKDIEFLRRMPVTIYGNQGDAQPPPSNHLLKFTNDWSFTNTVTTPSGYEISVPPDRDQTIVPGRLKEETVKVNPARLMPQFAARPVEYFRLCWDAVTPMQDHLISRHPHPRLHNLFFAIGGSFHSYKFLPTIGKYVVNVLDGKGNNEEQNKHWAWKRGPQGGRGAHEKVHPSRELRDLLDEPQSRLSRL